MTRTSIAPSIRTHLLAGATLFMVIGGGITAWAARTEVAGAIIAPGQLVVASFVKKVQHETGGTVRDIRIKDGDLVQAGQILVRLDDTIPRANLALIDNELDELSAARARVEAEREGVSHIEFPASLRRDDGDPRLASIIAGVAKQFESGLNARSGQRAQLQSRIEQLQHQLDGAKRQSQAKQNELDLIDKELVGLRGLLARRYVQITTVNNMERDRIRIDGEYGQLLATMGEIGIKIAETRLQMLQIDKDLGKDGEKELEQNRARTSELRERRIAAQDQLSRVDIRAPQDGRVHELSVHTVGGTVAPQGEPIMLIVPDDQLEVEAKVLPDNIDQLHAGKTVVLRFPGLNQRTTPEISGHLKSISADAIADPKTGANYFRARIEIKNVDVEKLGEIKLVPGMPCEALIETSASKPIYSFIFKPVSDQFAKAFR